MTDPTRTLVETDDGLTEGLTLLPDTDPAAREAIKTYIEATDDDAVATELQAWLDRCSDQELRTDGGIDIIEVAASHRDVLATVAQLHDDRPPRGTDIAANCGVDDDHIYTILQILENREYIDRQADPHDERVRRVCLTEAGITILQQLQARYAELNLDATDVASARQSLRTDGGTPIPKPSIPDDGPATLGLSMFVDTPTTTVDTGGEATIRVRPDHGDVRIEAAEDGDRTAEAVLAGSPVAMATLADELYAAAATAAHDTDESDPLDGDRDG